MIRVVVDYDRCESNAVCMGILPEVFEVRDDNFLYVLNENPPEEPATSSGRPSLPARRRRSHSSRTDYPGQPRQIASADAERHGRQSEQDPSRPRPHRTFPNRLLRRRRRPYRSLQLVLHAAP